MRAIGSLVLFDDYNIGEAVRELAKEVDEKASRTTPTKEQNRDLIAMFVFQSNKLERTGTEKAKDTFSILKTLDDVPLDDVRTSIDTKLVDVEHTEKRLQVLNQFHALKYLMAQKVLTAAVLCETHKILMTGLSAESGGRKEAMTAGAFRPKGVLCVANGGEKVYYDPIRIEGGVKSLCENTEAYLGDKLLLSYQVAAYAMTFFLEIHPFDDGNGRLARLLANYVLYRRGFPIVVAPLSHDYIPALKKDQSAAAKRGSAYQFPHVTKWMLQSCLQALDNFHNAYHAPAFTLASLQ